MISLWKISNKWYADAELTATASSLDAIIFSHPKNCYNASLKKISHSVWKYITKWINKNITQKIICREN